MPRRARRSQRGQGISFTFLRARGTLDARAVRRRTGKLADAAAASEEMPRHPPKEIDRAAARKAEIQRRAAERRARFLAEQERQMEQARLIAAAEWDARVQAVRERAEAQARANTEAIERARRLRIERGLALAEQRRAIEEERLQRVRDAEARRRQEALERTERRLAELAARRRIGRDAEETVLGAYELDEMQRQREIELARAQVVQLRSEEARELARTWVVAPNGDRVNQAPPPIPGEQRALEVLMVELPRVAEPARPVYPQAEASAPSEPPQRQPPRDGETTISLVDVAPRRPKVTGRPRETDRDRERRAVTPLDIDALNDWLRGD